MRNGTYRTHSRGRALGPLQHETSRLRKLNARKTKCCGKHATSGPYRIHSTVRNRRDPARIRADSSGAAHRAGGPALIPPDPGFFSPPFDALCRRRERRPHTPCTRRDAGLSVRNRRDPLKIRADYSGAARRAGGPALILPDPGFFSLPFDALCRRRARMPRTPHTARHQPFRAKSA